MSVEQESLVRGSSRATGMHVSDCFFLVNIFELLRENSLRTNFSSSATRFLSRVMLSASIIFRVYDLNWKLRVIMITLFYFAKCTESTTRTRKLVALVMFTTVTK